MLKVEGENKCEDTRVKKEDILDKAQSAYEAVVAIAKEARRLNAAPGVYLKGDERPLPRAVRNFVNGKVDYEVGEDDPADRSPGRG
jgi:DNA-directed RNA polymerase subunit K/omega